MALILLLFYAEASAITYVTGSLGKEVEHRNVLDTSSISLSLS